MSAQTRKHIGSRSRRLSATISSPTGALTYQYPVNVAPGRNGMQPHIALAYNSQGAIYGGIAAYWSLSGIPIVEEDVSGGRLDGTKHFQSSLSGNRPLIEVDECR